MNKGVCQVSVGYSGCVILILIYFLTPNVSFFSYFNSVAMKTVLKNTSLYIVWQNIRHLWL